MTASAPTKIERASLRAPFVCTYCRRDKVPVVVIPANHTSLEGNHQLCADCITEIAATLGLKVVTADTPGNDAAVAIEFLNERNERLRRFALESALVIRSLVRSGYGDDKRATVCCPYCYTSFRNANAVTAHIRESHGNEQADPIDLTEAATRRATEAETLAS